MNKNLYDKIAALQSHKAIVKRLRILYPIGSLVQYSASANGNNYRSDGDFDGIVTGYVISAMSRTRMYGAVKLEKDLKLKVLVQRTLRVSKVNVLGLERA